MVSKLEEQREEVKNKMTAAVLGKSRVARIQVAVGRIGFPGKAAEELFICCSAAATRVVL